MFGENLYYIKEDNAPKIDFKHETFIMNESI